MDNNILVHVPRGTLEHFPKSNGLYLSFKRDFVETKLDKRRHFYKTDDAFDNFMSKKSTQSEIYVKRNLF